MKRRTYIILALFGVVWVLLIARIFYISINLNPYYEELANKNAVKTEHLAPLRGIIYDRKNRPLAVNQLGFAIGIKPQLSLKSNIAKLEEELDFLVREIPSLNREKLKSRYLKNDSLYEHNIVQVVDFLLHDEVISSFSKINLRENLSIYPISRRYYPYDMIASHIVGYVGRANREDYVDTVAKLTGSIGRTGIERYYDDILKGESGIQLSKVNALNRQIEIIERKAPVSKDMYLSIDIELQKYISSLFKGKSGSAVVIDLKDGSILSAVSFPEYDPNKFVAGISHEEWKALSMDFNHPFTNKFINGLYPPGSVVKMGVALSFLDTKEITPSTTFDCKGYIEFGGRTFRCWKHSGHGITNMKKAIRESCDTYFYEGALKVGIDAISPVLERLGFGAKTGIDLPNEFIGVVPSREWKMRRYSESWFHGETVISSIGQGFFLSTSMQVARHTAMIATGRNITPHFLQKINNKKVEYKTDDTIFNDTERRYLPLIREAMMEVSNNPMGTAYYNTRGSKIKIAGKTGTAQVVSLPQEEKIRMKESELEYYQRSHGWFTSFGPYKNPRYAVTVLVEHAGAAGPATLIAVDIYNKLYEVGYITSLE
ncbi:MAG: penicillin-binding protein 2 [Campylobacteraceae bacterium]|jgi:penicillin-binding protein 2|nr:penicillin-binding protein 2 [Campylobacteraceae bacterium]